MTTSLRVAAQRWNYCCLMFVLFIAGCASIREVDVSVAKPSLGMEQLLRLPVTKGHEGVNQVIHALQAVYGVGAAENLSMLGNTGSVVSLADGFIVSKAFTDIREPGIGWRQVAFEVADKPCFAIERAAALIGAKKMDEYLGDGVGYVGHTEYLFDNHEINIRLTAIHPGPHCLGAVWIHKKFP